MVKTRAQEKVAARNRQNASKPPHDLLTKAEVKGAVEQLNRTGVWNGRISKSAIFEQYQDLKSSGYVHSGGRFQT